MFFNINKSFFNKGFKKDSKRFNKEEKLITNFFKNNEPYMKKYLRDILKENKYFKYVDNGEDYIIFSVNRKYLERYEKEGNKFFIESLNIVLNKLIDLHYEDDDIEYEIDFIRHLDIKYDLNEKHRITINL